MNIEQMKASIGAQQDQEIEDAKKWMRGDGPKGTLNAQIHPLWEYCCSEHYNEINDVMSRFALIGIRHVLERMT